MFIIQLQTASDQIVPADRKILFKASNLLPLKSTCNPTILLQSTKMTFQASQNELNFLSLTVSEI